MNRQTTSILAIAALAGAVALGYWLAGARTPHGTGHAGGPAPATGTANGREILYWYDPMRPDVKFDQPGPSPFMDMPLVPKYADEQPGEATVRVRPDVAQTLGIRLGKVERAALAPRLSAVGSVAFDEDLLHVVQARVEGYVIRLHVRAALEPVRRGQALADIQSPAWLAAQEEYLALLDAGTERARAIRDAARQRLAVLGVPEATIRRIEETRRTDAVTTIVAPADGFVTELAVREGAAFMPGAALFRINGLQSVWANAQVPEARVGAIRGSTVVIRATAWPGTTFKGRVAALLPEVDLATRTLPVRIRIENPGRKLVPGMFVTLDFTGEPGEPQLVVPTEAVIVSGERSVVIVPRAGGGFGVAEVVVGAEADGRTAILSGLVEGQPVVLSGQFLIDSEASLTSTITRLESGAASREEAP